MEGCLGWWQRRKEVAVESSSLGLMPSRLCVCEEEGTRPLDSWMRPSEGALHCLRGSWGAAPICSACS